MADIKQVVAIPQLKTLLAQLKSKFVMSVNGNKPDANGKVTIPTFTGATSTSGGTNGLVPAPATGKQSTVLKGDGTWGDLSVMTGATTSAAGASGLVPTPSAGSSNRYLSANGQWQEVEKYVLPKATASVLGGIKVGDGLSVLDGLLSATASAANTGGIVAANLADNGYVKFANGLIVQWGHHSTTEKYDVVYYPLAFSSRIYTSLGCDDGTARYSYSVAPDSLTSFHIAAPNSGCGVYWLVIGI